MIINVNSNLESCTCSPVSGPGCPAAPAAAAQTEVLGCPPAREVDFLKGRRTRQHVKQPLNDISHKENFHFPLCFLSHVKENQTKKIQYTNANTQTLTYICEILLSYFDFQRLRGQKKRHCNVTVTKEESICMIKALIISSLMPNAMTMPGYEETIKTYSFRVQEMGADLRCKCAGVFRTGAQVGLHGEVKQLVKTHRTMNGSRQTHTHTRQR